MEIIREQIKASQYVGHKNFVELVEGDIVVSDIKPDILSLVKVVGKPFITSKEVLDKKVKIKGVVDIYAIYIADDEKNSLKGITASLNFEETFDMDNVESGMTPIVKYKLGPIESRVLNSRKITVKCPVEIDLKIMKKLDFEIATDILDENDIQVLKNPIEINTLVGCNSEVVSISDNVSLSENNLPIGEILECNIDIINEDYKISYNKVLAKADAKVNMVYIADDNAGTIQTFETLIPFTGFIDIEGITDTAELEIIYNLENYYIKPIYQEMKANSVSIEASVEILVIAHESKEVITVQDVYNPNEVLKFDAKAVEIDQSNKNNIHQANIKQVLSIPELENSRLFDVMVRSGMIEKKELDDRIVVDGNVSVEISYYQLDKKMIETKKIELPFQETIPVDRNSRNDISMDVLDVDYEMLQPSQLQISIGIIFQNDSVNKLRIYLLDNLEQTNEKQAPVASIVVYPVKAGDSLWSIAKKFRTTVDSIKESNELVDDKIFPGEQLIIPKRIFKAVLNPLN